MIIRDFRMGDQEELSRLIRRTLIEVNTDCPKDEVAFLYDLYTPEKVIANAAAGHTIVVACFLLPEAIGRGLGRKLFDLLESDPLFTGADRVWLTSSNTALKFYEHIGYTYEGGYCHLDEEGLIVMEKFPKK